MIVQHANAGGWSNDPAAPLVLGEIMGLGDHAMVRTPDNAVWSSWVDNGCFGSLRVQRVNASGQVLAVEALTLFTRNDCLARDARAAACADGSAVVAAIVGGVNSSGSLNDQPLQRINASGASMWGNGIVLTVPPGNPGGASGKIGQLLGADNGDVLIAWHAGSTVFVSRIDASGNDVWNGPATIATLTGVSKRIVALVADDAGDMIVVWDEPGPYVRGVFAARVSASGQSLWAQPTNVVPTVNGSSRHTDPVVVTDGSGGSVVVFTEGAESSDTPMPLRMQRIFSDGSLAFDAAGLRVSIDSQRQFDSVIARDTRSDDILITWRSGVQQQAIKSQRMTLTGNRLWGDTGIIVKTLGQAGFGRDFNADWNGADRLLSVIIDDAPPPGSDARVHVHRVNGAGSVNPIFWPVSGNVPPVGVHCVALDDALAIGWLHDAPTFPDFVVAQRINDDGTIGLPPRIGDINGDGGVNVIDMLAVINAWGTCPAPPQSCDADVAPAPAGDGAVNVIDLLTIINNWG